MAYVFIYQHFLLVEATQLHLLAPPHHPDCGTQFPSQPCCAPELFLWLSPLPYIRTLRKAIESQSEIKRVLILHSDQGSQYTSKDFTEYSKRMAVTQSMSKAGYPYDNAPMERYFNTLYRARYPQRMKSKGQAVYAEKECPRCGANFIPDQDGCCSYCGYRLPIDNSKWRILEQ